MQTTSVSRNTLIFQWPCPLCRLVRALLTQEAWCWPRIAVSQIPSIQQQLMEVLSHIQIPCLQIPCRTQKTNRAQKTKNVTKRTLGKQSSLDRRLLLLNLHLARHVQHHWSQVLLFPRFARLRHRSDQSNHQGLQGLQEQATATATMSCWQTCSLARTSIARCTLAFYAGQSINHLRYGGITPMLALCSIGSMCLGYQSRSSILLRAVEVSWAAIARVAATGPLRGGLKQIFGIPWTSRGISKGPSSVPFHVFLVNKRAHPRGPSLSPGMLRSLCALHSSTSRQTLAQLQKLWMRISPWQLTSLCGGCVDDTSVSLDCRILGLQAECCHALSQLCWSSVYSLLRSYLIWYQTIMPLFKRTAPLL